MAKISNIGWSIFYIYKNSFLGFHRYSGRTSRLEFWSFQIVYGLLMYLLVTANDMALLLTLVATGVLLPSIVACHVRRLHDVEHSAWFLLPKFFYVPWFLLGVRALLQQGVMLNDFLFQPSGQPLQWATQFRVLSLFYCSLIYEIILLVSYCQRGTNGDNIYGKDAIVELKNNIKIFIATHGATAKPGQKPASKK
ncbi:MAG: DUF805 domain-containing protein [Hydrotalea sp.]|nr:DUF805 domain-containing protein [Hydrotalea sp.]